MTTLLTLPDFGDPPRAGTAVTPTEQRLQSREIRVSAVRDARHMNGPGAPVIQGHHLGSIVADGRHLAAVLTDPARHSLPLVDQRTGILGIGDVIAEPGQHNAQPSDIGVDIEPDPGRLGAHAAC